MVGQSRARKRVHALRRAADGSAFEKCDNCGVFVAISLSDMHECEVNGLKRFKGVCGQQRIAEQKFDDQPRSPFRFFMESFFKIHENDNTIDVDGKGFETWKHLSGVERKPYIFQADKVNSDHTKALLKEASNMLWVDDEADSAEVGKYDERYEKHGYYYHQDDSESSGTEMFWSETSESFNAFDWAMVNPWIFGKPP